MLIRPFLSALARVPLTLQRARAYLLWGCFSALLASMFSLQQLHKHAYGFAGLMLFVAILQLVYIPLYWKVYQRIRRGEVVHVFATQPIHVSRIWSFVAAVLLTAIVGAETFMCWMIIQTGRTNWIVWLIMGVVNLLLWALVVYVWIRVLSQRPNDVIYDAVNGEPQEGVWPPPPKILKDEKERE